MENVTLNLINDFLIAVQNGHTNKLGALLHPDIVWSQPGDNQISGVKNSSAEVFGMVGKMFELSSNTLALTDIKILAANGNSVACLVHWKATNSSGKSLAVDNIDVYTVENDKIVKATIFSADIDQEDEFWGKH